MGNFSIFDYSGNPGVKKSSPSWASKISKGFRTIFSNPDAAVPIARTDKGGTDAVTVNISTSDVNMGQPHLWRVHNQRKTVYNDIDQMDSHDELVSTALDIIADFAAGYDEEGIAFRVDAKGNAKVQKILDDLVRRLDLQNDIHTIVRAMVKHGNEMREVLIDRKTSRIVSLKQTISYQIYPKLSKTNDKVPGWFFVQEKDVYNGGGGTPMEEWQILPFCYGERRGALCVPILASARKNWQRLAMIEDGMGIARLVRAYDRLVHRVPTNPNWTPEQVQNNLNRYKEAITKRKLMSADGDMNMVDSPLQVQTDFFLPDIGDNRGGVDVLNSTNLQLGNLNDVYYHRERLLARLRVPIAYLQIMSTQKTHLKSGAVGDADIMFSRMLRGIHSILRRGLKRLFDMELALQGEVAEGAYVIHFTRVSTDNLLEMAKIELTFAQAAAYFIEAFGALPPELVASMFMRLDEKQQDIMDKFLKSNGSKIQAARIKALETAAEPKIGLKDRMPGDNSGGSGNNNKSRTSRSSEQKGASQSVVSLEEAVEVFYALHEAEVETLQNMGLEVPDVSDSFKDVVRQNLTDLAIADNVGDE